MRSLYIFPTGACDARHLGHRSQGALLGVVESVRCGSQDGMTWEAWEGAGIMAGELKLQGRPLAPHPQLHPASGPSWTSGL